MDIEQVKANLVGKTILKIEAEEWDDENHWLADFGSVRIHLSDGTILDTLGEPLEVSLPTVQ